MHIGCLRGKIDGGTHGETNAGARKMPKSVQFPGWSNTQPKQQPMWAHVVMPKAAQYSPV